MKEKKKINKKLLISAIILFAGNLLLFLTIWMMGKYEKVYFDQFLFQMKSSSQGVHRELANSAVTRVLGLGIISTVVEVLFYRLLSGRMEKLKENSKRYVKYCASKACVFFQKRVLPISLSVFIVSTGIFVTRLEIFAYAQAVSTESGFIELNYKSPNEVDLIFPKEKRNLIYIFLESMENTFADKQNNSYNIDFIPELTALANDNISFSNTDGVGGVLSFGGTNWTAASMVSQTSGVTVKVPFSADAYGDNTVFIPGIISIGEVLEKQGYNQTVLMGSDAYFHGRETYFTDHGNYKILDTKSLKTTGRLPEDYREWWGFEDEKLFAFAKEELIHLSKENKPFNLTMLTADTHFPNGYKCSLCKDTYKEQYANVLACSSKQVASFVEWIKAQDFYKNTTVIICGDHLTMDSDFLSGVDEEYVRTNYNCIINSAVTTQKQNNRQFGSFDMFPTTLAAMGVKIKGDRLGLGTNLFSNKKTLTEEYGFDVLNEELKKQSTFYNREFLGEE